MQVSGVPSSHYNTTVSGIIQNLVNTLLKLINTLTIIIFKSIVFSTIVTPLEAIHRAEITFWPVS